ncbi:MAG: sulfotransferase [Actinomycetota bacterium]
MSEVALSAVAESPGRHGAPDRDVKVLYIIGWGRSGSTIMDNLLGELDGFFSAGELTYLWERGLLEGRRCGCGALVRACPVWSSVLARGWGEPFDAALDPDEVVSWQREAVRVRHTLQLLRRSPAGAGRNDALGRYVTVTSRLLASIADVTGARVIVDSSKRPSDAALLRLVPGVTPYFVQLVRDPRAVAYSWRRRKAQPDRNRPAELVQHAPVDSTLSWLGWNLAAEALRRRYDPARSLLLRYEDFVARPRDALLAMAHLVGEDPADLPLEGAKTARLAPNHTVSGNPSRFKTGTVELREDTEWTGSQRRADRITATTLSLPLLARYDYPLRPGKASKAGARRG